MWSSGPLHHASYRWLFAGVSVNQLGNGIAPVALAFAVLDLGGGATQLGLVVGAYALADLVAVLFGGVLGDRLPRTTMMRASCTAAGASQAVAALSLLGGWSSIRLLGAVGVVNGALSALGNPSSNAVTPQTVPPDLLGAAVAWRRLGQNVALIVGNGVAGILVAGLGSGWALGVDAATFLVAAACFAGVRVPRPVVTERHGVLAEAGAGLREVLRHTWLWVLLLQAMLYHLFYGGAQSVLGPIVVGDTLGRPAWGWALGTMMAGFVVGGLLCLRWRPRHALLVGTCFLALTACFPVAMALSGSLVVVLAGAFVHGFGLEVFSVGWDLSIQENVAPDMLSRVYSFDLIGSFLVRPLGLALTGPVAALVGLHAWLVVVGLVIVASVALSLFVPDVRRLQRRTPEPAVAA